MSSDTHPGARSLSELTVDALLAAVAAPTAAPGGGAVAALAGALAAALVSMVAGLTVGRPRYADAQERLATILSQAAELRLSLTEAMSDDAAAYEAVLEAYRLPKETPQQAERRTVAIQAGLTRATAAPLRVAGACLAVLELTHAVTASGNRHAIDDAVAAAWLAHAGLLVATRNVRANLQGLEDGWYRASAEARAAELLARGADALAAALAAANERQ